MSPTLRIFAAAAIALTGIGASISATAQTAPASTAPAVEPRKFAVIFARGALTVSRDHVEELERVIGYAQRNRTMRVMLTGYAAGQGSETWRTGRAQRMVTAVQEYLAENGVNGARIGTQASNMAPDTMPAPAGISDAAASRVEIQFMR